MTVRYSSGIPHTFSRRTFTHRTFAASLLVAVVALLIVAGTHLVLIFPHTPDRLVVSEPPKPAGAIVLLEGGLLRIDTALDLVASQYSSTIIYPGILPFTERILTERAAARDVTFTLLSGSDTLGTYHEALNTREILRKHPEIRSVLLVTSNYHSFRAQWTFCKVLPRHVTITSVPATERWWSNQLAAVPDTPANRTYRSEQLKFLGYYLLYGWRLYP